MKALLTADEFDAIVRLCREARVPERSRDSRFQSIPPGIAYAIPPDDCINDQFDAELRTVAEQPADGDGPPLARWLVNAARQIDTRPEAIELRSWAHLVRARADAPPIPCPAQLVITARDRLDRTHTGAGVLIAPDRALTAWALIADGDRIHPRCTVRGPDGVARHAIPDRDRSHQGAGWATLHLPSGLPGVTPAPIGRPASPGAPAAVDGRPARIIDPAFERDFAPVMTLALGGPPARPPLGAPILADGAVIGVALHSHPDPTRFVDAARGDALADLDLRPAPADIPDATGPLGRAIQIDRESQWYRLLDLVRQERSGLVILHGDATQALHHFVDRMERDLGNPLTEPITVRRVPYRRSSIGSPPTSAEEWTRRAAEALGRAAASPTAAIKAATDETRLVLVLDAPIRPGAEPYDKALIVDFAEREAPRLLAAAVGHHRLHIMLAITYAARDRELLRRLRKAPAPPVVLEQVTFPDWDDHIEPFLEREGVSELDRLQLRAHYDAVVTAGGSFDRLARAIQAVLDTLDRRAHGGPR